MRDRLIKLVDKAKEEYANDITDHTETDYIVEALLNEGAILPPCKVGDIVWGILGDTVCPWKVFFRTYSDDEGWWVFLGWNGEDRHARIFGDCFHQKYFLTKEEAEEKLQEMKTKE